MRRGGAEDERPLRPRVFGHPDERRLRHELELEHTLRPLAERGSDAIGARIPSPKDDHVLAGRQDRSSAFGVAGHATVLLLEVVHRDVHAG